MNKLSYEEWREHIGVSIDPKMVEELEKYHNVDGYAEIESVLRQEYEFYLKEE